MNSTKYKSANVLIQNVVHKHNGYVDFTLMHHLKPNEFFVYTYLLNAPSDYKPSYESFAVLLGLRSKTSIGRIVDKLKSLGLVEIERLETIYVWTVYYKPSIEKSEFEEDFKKGEIKLQTKNDRLDLVDEIDRLEKLLDVADITEMDNIMEQIIDARGRLNKVAKHN